MMCIFLFIYIIKIIICQIERIITIHVILHPNEKICKDKMSSINLENFCDKLCSINMFYIKINILKEIINNLDLFLEFYTSNQKAVDLISNNIKFISHKVAYLLKHTFIKKHFIYPYGEVMANFDNICKDLIYKFCFNVKKRKLSQNLNPTMRFCEFLDIFDEILLLCFKEFVNKIMLQEHLASILFEKHNFLLPHEYYDSMLNFNDLFFASVECPNYLKINDTIKQKFDNLNEFTNIIFKLDINNSFISIILKSFNNKEDYDLKENVKLRKYLVENFFIIHNQVISYLNQTLINNEIKSIENVNILICFDYNVILHCFRHFYKRKSDDYFLVKNYLSDIKKAINDSVSKGNFNRFKSCKIVFMNPKHIYRINYLRIYKKPMNLLINHSASYKTDQEFIESYNKIFGSLEILLSQASNTYTIKTNYRSEKSLLLNVESVDTLHDKNIFEILINLQHDKLSYFIQLTQKELEIVCKTFNDISKLNFKHQLLLIILFHIKLNGEEYEKSKSEELVKPFKFCLKICMNVILQQRLKLYTFFDVFLKKIAFFQLIKMQHSPVLRSNNYQFPGIKKFKKNLDYIEMMEVKIMIGLVKELYEKE